MRLCLPLIGLLLLLLPAAALAASGDNATVNNLTPVSVFQNASIFVNKSTDNLTLVGSFDNATVYRGGGANITLMDHSARVDMGSAPEMGYRDIYLFIRMPVAAFGSVGLDYDLSVGEKSNVLLVDFNTTLPRTGIRKGGIPDRAILGLGTWSAAYGDIGGLRPFPPGAHRLEIQPIGGELVLKVDGQGLVSTQYKQQDYLIVHLMTGDGNSYLQGTISNLTYAGPPPRPLATPSSTPLPRTNVSATVLPSAGKSTPVPPVNLSGSDPGKSNNATPQSRLLPEVNIAFVLIALFALVAAWAFVYLKYLRK